MVEFPFGVAFEFGNWAIDEVEQRPQEIRGAAGINLWRDGSHALDEAPTNNHVGEIYFSDHMRAPAFVWHTEIDPDVGGDVSTLDSAPEPDVVVVGQRIYWVVYDDSSDAPVPSTDPTIEPGENGAPAAAIELIDACPVEQSAAADSLNSLYNNSPTARALIDAMRANGTSLNLITASLSGFAPQARFDSPTNQILWDPFVYIEGTNTNGSTYTMAPIMVLAHELVHAGHAGEAAYQGASSEGLVMQVANQIASELNAATGSSYDTTRDSHVRSGQFNTTSPTSIIFSIARPGCAS